MFQGLQREAMQRPLQQAPTYWPLVSKQAPVARTISLPDSTRMTLLPPHSSTRTDLTISLDTGSLAADAGNRLRGVNHDLLCHAVGGNRAAEVLGAGRLDHAGLEDVEVGGVNQRNGQSAVRQDGLAVGRDGQRIRVVVALGAESDVSSLHRSVLSQRGAGKEANGEDGGEELHVDGVGGSGEVEVNARDAEC